MFLCPFASAVLPSPLHSPNADLFSILTIILGANKTLPQLTPPALHFHQLPGRLPLVAALKTHPAPSGSGNLGSDGREGPRTQGGSYPYFLNPSRTNTSQYVPSL